MAWDFETEPELQAQLEWADEFVRAEVEPLEFVYANPYDKSDHRALSTIRPLQEAVRRRGLWACHLEPELGGQGYGQVKLALLNEILGRARWAPIVFGCQAPDSGNAEILAKYGTDEQRAKYLQPLLDGSVTSCFSMTEPDGGSDPTRFRTRAVRDGDSWVIDGEKWFTTNARYASFLVVLAVTDSEAEPHRRTSMFLVPAETAGLELIRNVGLGTDPLGHGSEGYVRYNNVRVPADYLLGGEGDGFTVAQTRLAGGRLHHAMRTLAQLRRSFDLMCERAVSRQTRRGTLGSLQMTQERIADSWLEIEQFRLLVLRTAWLIDKHGDYDLVRKDIAAVKAAMPKVLHDVTQRALHLHGALGVSNEMPFMAMMTQSEVLAVADGPTEVHKVALAREVLKGYKPVGRWPSGHIPRLRADARARFAALIEDQVGNE